MIFGLFGKRKREKLIKNIIEEVIRTGFGPPPEFFTPSELEELNTSVRMAEEYESLFTTIEYPEELQVGREIEYSENDYYVEQLP